MRLALALWCALLAVQVSAAPPLLCVKETKEGLEEPATLSALLACHKKKLDEAGADYLAKHGKYPSDSRLDGWQDAQRAEVNEYIARHPDRAELDNPAGAEEIPEPEAAAKTKPKDSETRKLEQALKDESQGGKDGITPEMARQMDEFLNKREGQMSPEMRQLLDGAQKDGPDLSDDTMNRLKDAAKKAKESGLDLGIDKQTEEELLTPKKPAPGQN